MCNLSSAQKANVDKYGGAVGNIFNTYSQMKAIQNQYDYAANVSENNAKLAEAQEMSVGQQGGYEQSQLRQRGAQVASAQKAGYSANGLDIGAGTPLASLVSTAKGTAEDVAMSKYNTQLKMWGLQQEANQSNAEASAYRQAGKNAKKSTLLTGLANAVAQYQNYGK